MGSPALQTDAPAASAAIAHNHARFAMAPPHQCALMTNADQKP
jgi:hypothetical protein